MSAPGLAGSRFHGNDGLGGSGLCRGSRFGVCRVGPRSGTGMTGVWGFRLLPGDDGLEYVAEVPDRGRG